MTSTTDRCIAIYGASGFGREVMPLVRARHADGAAIVFVDDGQANGDTILSFEQFCALPHRSKQFVIAIANSAVREKLVARCLAARLEPLEVRAENAVVLDDVQVGEGAILCPFALLTSTIRVGRYFHANNHAYVSHDCVIGDYVTLAPGAKVNGNIHIGDHAYIGSGAVIKQGTPDCPRRIGAGAVIGMGAVVTRDVMAGETVVGNPARPLRRS